MRAEGSTRESESTSFAEFFSIAEPRLRQALTAALGSDVARDAAAEALSYGWEHWGRVQSMANPIGYLFVVGRSRGRRMLRARRPVFESVDPQQMPWVEPALPDALSRLSARQRTVVVLLHCFGWSLSEVAELLDISRSTAQNHAERAMARLRTRLGVNL